MSKKKQILSYSLENYQGEPVGNLTIKIFYPSMPLYLQKELQMKILEIQNIVSKKPNLKEMNRQIELTRKDESLYSPGPEIQALDYIESLKSRMETLMLDIETTKQSASKLQQEINKLEK